MYIQLGKYVFKIDKQKGNSILVVSICLRKKLNFA